MTQQQAPYLADPITARRFELECMQNIPDMAAYAHEWWKLAAECDRQGRVATASMCRSKAHHYGELAGGEYVRLVYDTFVELITPAEAREERKAG